MAAAEEAWTRGSAARRRGLAVAAAEEEPWIRGAAARLSASRATHVPPPPPPGPATTYEDWPRRRASSVVVRSRSGWRWRRYVRRTTGWQMNVVHLVQRRRRWLILFRRCKVEGCGRDTARQRGARKVRGSQAQVLTRAPEDDWPHSQCQQQRQLERPPCDEARDAMCVVMSAVIAALRVQQVGT